MRILTLSKRCAKEILRDPLNLAFGLGFPIILLLLLSAIGANAPVPLFEISSLAPGVCVFGLSFISLFASSLIARDRETALLQRLYTTPALPSDFILGYMLPLLPIALGQAAICYGVAMILGLPPSPAILLGLLFVIPIAALFISIGLLFGSILNSKQVGGICGALLTNLSAWLSGTWFDLELVGGAFKSVAYVLPFVHAVEAQRAAIDADLSAAFLHTLPPLAYFSVTLTAAILLFLRGMKRG